MKIIILFTVVAFAAFVNAYDFKDEVYNQLIKQDLDELESYQETEKFVNYRRKREESKPTKEPKPTKETKPAKDTKVEEGTTPSSPDKCGKKKRFRMCCGEEIVEGIMEKDKELKKECYKDVTGQTKEEKPFGTYDPFNCEKVNKTKKEWACVMQCVGQKKNVIDEDGNIKEKEAMAHYKKEFGKEEWFLKLVEQAFPKCLEQSRNITGFVKNKEDHLSCSPAPMKMHHCMWREIQLTCPDDKITDVKMCNKIREKVRKHEDLPFRHGHHGHDDD